MFMMGAEAGFDMTTQEGLNEFMLAYNASLAQDTDEVENLGATEALPKSRSQMLPGSRLSVAERKSRRKQLRKRLAKPKRDRRKNWHSLWQTQIDHDRSGDPSYKGTHNYLQRFASASRIASSIMSSCVPTSSARKRSTK